MYRSYFAPMQSRLFPSQTHAGKLGNELVLHGRVSAKKKKEACSSTNNPWCYFAVSENNPHPCSHALFPWLKFQFSLNLQIVGNIYKLE